MRAYLDAHWHGNKSAGTKYTDLWTFAEAIDLTVAEAHRQGGMRGVNHVLATSDQLEHMLSRIGAEMSLQLTGDWEMFEQLLSTRPPGRSQVLPDWAVVAARGHSKVVHQQQQWLRGDGQASDGDGGGAPRRLRNRPKKPKAKADAGKGKGKDGQQAAATPKS